MPASTITTDVLEDTDIDDAAEALLKRWTKPAKAETTTTEEEDTEVEEQDEATETGDEEVDGEGEETDEGEEKPETKFKLADDDHEVIIKVGEDNHKVKVSDLKRLWGQEAALTQKSQAVAAAHEAAAAAQTKYTTAVEKQFERAKAAYEPFSKIDWVLAQSQVSSGEVTKEEFQQARNLAIKSFNDVKFFEQELDGVVKETAKANHENLMAQAVECNKVLADPEKGIKGWGNDLYQEIRTYALGMGVDQQIMNTIVNPAAIKILHKAMQFDRAQKTALKKVVNAPKNVNKTPSNGAATHPGEASARKSLEKLRRSGSPDDAAELLLARWKQSE